MHVIFLKNLHNFVYLRYTISKKVNNYIYSRYIIFKEFTQLCILNVQNFKE